MTVKVFSVDIKKGNTQYFFTVIIRLMIHSRSIYSVESRFAFRPLMDLELLEDNLKR